MFKRRPPRPLLIITCSFFVVTIGCNKTQTLSSFGNSSDGTIQIGFESKNLPVLSKVNLQTLLLGKNKLEVQELLGPPEGKSLDGGNGYLWDYRRPVYDDATQKTYDWSLVSFKFIGGLCAIINIRLENSPTFILSDSVKNNSADENGN